MKRAISICMVLALLAALGAPSAASGYTGADVRAILETIGACVAQTDGILSSARALIDWQLEDSAAELEAYREALRNGEEYESEDNYDEVRAKADELDASISSVVALRAQVDALRVTGLESVDETVAAAKTYFAWLEDALRDLMSIFDFYFAEYEAAEGLAAYDIEQYSDMSEAIAELYYVIQDMTDAMEVIDCPAFMQECFDKYIRATRKYLAVLETMYTAIQIEDVLRSASANYLLGRMQIEVGYCEIELTELFNLQYEKVRNRLDGNIGTLKSELDANCQALLGAL
ncbi:MAG: hypothetical protein BWY35_00753 [Firmicutes bacterium ADurb.Bin248]|nr:MAG: hypothetical protein BWY35_00753 [Firmicutes bacterium ADurb.Bin248]HPK15080.1 hypothetical protein [Clostridia bacterium]